MVGGGQDQGGRAKAFESSSPLDHQREEEGRPGGAFSEVRAPLREERLGFVMKFQQTTSPVTAKGIEDTALYIYSRLLSLNEVGGEPERFGLQKAVRAGNAAGAGKFAECSAWRRRVRFAAGRAQ